MINMPEFPVGRVLEVMQDFVHEPRRAGLSSRTLVQYC